MINYAVIGRNFVVDRFIEGARETKKFNLKAIYSRNSDTGREFADKHSIESVYTSLDELLSDESIDAVYIASPNVCHYEQAYSALLAGKHVLLEKPAVVKYKELEKLLLLADEKKLVFMEAMMPAHMPALEGIRKLMPEIGKIRRANFVFCQYSSRYDKFKNGEILNAFRPELLNGALTDIGIYCIHMMIMLFGMPADLIGKSIFLKDSIDGEGSLLASYDEMLCDISFSKISDSAIPSEIQGEKGSVIIDSVSQPRKITLKLRNGHEECFDFSGEYSSMYYEALDFSKQIKGESMPVFNEYSKMAVKILEQATDKLNITFR